MSAFRIFTGMVVAAVTLVGCGEFCPQSDCPDSAELTVERRDGTQVAGDRLIVDFEGKQATCSFATADQDGSATCDYGLEVARGPGDGSPAIQIRFPHAVVGTVSIALQVEGETIAEDSVAADYGDSESGACEDTCRIWDGSLVLDS